MLWINVKDDRTLPQGIEVDRVNDSVTAVRVKRGDIDIMVRLSSYGSMDIAVPAPPKMVKKFVLTLTPPNLPAIVQTLATEKEAHKAREAFFDLLNSSECCGAEIKEVEVPDVA